MQIDRTPTDGAAAGHGNAREPGAGDERSQDERRGSHRLNDLVFRDRVREHTARDGSAMLCASVSKLYLSAHGDEQLPFGLDIANLRNIFEDDLVLRKDGGRHTGKGGVLST